MLMGKIYARLADSMQKQTDTLLKRAAKYSSSISQALLSL